MWEPQKRERERGIRDESDRVERTYVHSICLAVTITNPICPFETQKGSFLCNTLASICDFSPSFLCSKKLYIKKLFID